MARLRLVLMVLLAGAVSLAVGLGMILPPVLTAVVQFLCLRILAPPRLAEYDGTQ
jgi:hypothetical protein